MPIVIPVEAQPDIRSFKRSADSIERMFVIAGRDAGASFSKSFVGGASRDMDKAARELSKTYDAVSNAAGRAKSAEAERQRQMERSKSLTDQLAKAEKKYADALNSEGAEAKATTTALREVQRIKDAQSRTNVQIVKSTEAVKRSRREEVQSTKSAVAAYRELEQAQRAASSASGGMKGPGLGSGLLSQSSGMVGQFASLGGSGGRAFVTGAAAAIIAGNFVELGSKAAGMVVEGFKSVMKDGLDFSEAANNIQGVTGSTAAEMERIVAVARQLGADATLPGASASGALNAMGELIRQGFSPDKAMESTRSVLELATATQSSVEDAANAVGTSLSAFGIDTAQSQKVVDSYANAILGPVDNLQNLQLALQQVAPVAASFGIGLEDTLASISMLYKMGMKGPDAGTSLKTMLQSVVKDGEPAAEAARNLGLALFDMKGNFVGMDEFWRQLDAAKSRMSQQDFLTNTNRLFGSDSMRPAVLANSALFNQLRADMDKVGSAGDMMKAQMQGWPGTVKGVSNAFGELKLSIFDVFNSPEWASGGQDLIAGIDRATQWVKTHQPEIIDGLTTIGAGFTRTGEVVAGFVAETTRMMGQWVGGMTAPLAAVLNKVGDFMMGIGKAMSYVPGLKGMAAEISKSGAEAILGGTVLSNSQAYFDNKAAQADAIRNAFSQATDWLHETGNSMADAARARRDNAGIGGYAGSGGISLPSEEQPAPPAVIPGPGVSMGSNSGSGSSGSDKNAFVDPSLYQVADVALAQGNSQEILDVNRAYITAKNNLEESKLKLSQLEAKGTEDQLTVMRARNEVHQNEMALQSAQMKLAEAQNGTLKKMESTAGQFANGMDKIGAAIDADFGISDGLPGIAENLTKFLANLALAPVVGALTGVQMAAGYNPSSGGSGLMGILGAGGAFGPQYMPGYSTFSAGYRGGMGGYPGDAALLSMVPAGRYSQTGNADLVQGLGDCSSAVEDLVNIMDGRPTGGRSMSTGNAAEWLTAHGFLPGSMPGAFNVGFNAGHMQATLPGGTPFNWGSDASAAAGGIGGSGAFDPSLTSHFYRPVGGPALLSPVLPSSGPSYPTLSPSALTNPGLTPAPVAPSSPVIAPGAGIPAGATSTLPTWGGGNTGLPSVTGGGGGRVYLGLDTGPGVGGAAGTAVGNQAYPTSGGAGFSGVGGAALGALEGAAAGLNAIAPGAGQAAQVGIQLANRFAGYLGQVAGIGVSGLLEAGLPAGDNPMASIGNSWFGKLAGGLAGARPALPNMAGQQAPPNPNDPNGTGATGSGGNTTNNTTEINVTNNRQTEEQTGQEIARQYHAAGKQ